MPLSHLKNMFEGVRFSDPEVVAYRPGFLFAQRISVWERDDIPPVTALLVARSPLVKDTKKIYRPVSDLILGSKMVDVLDSRRIVDSATVFGHADCMVLRLADHPPLGPYSIEDIKTTIKRGIDRYLEDRTVSR